MIVNNVLRCCLMSFIVIIWECLFRAELKILIFCVNSSQVDAAGCRCQEKQQKIFISIEIFSLRVNLISHPSNCARKRVSPISRDCRPWRSPPRRSWRTTARCPPGSSQSPAARSSQSQGGWGLLSHQSPNLLLGQSGALRHHYWHRQNDITDALV